MARKSGASVTIRDVAQRANVAVGTVSRVINGFQDVDETLRKRVEKAMRELCYRPNVRAQSFVRDRSPIVTFLLSNRGGLNPVHSLILQGVEEHCAEAGYFVLFARTQYSPDAPASEIRLPEVVTTNGLAEAVILAGSNYENLLEALEGLGVNYIALANGLVASRPRPAVNQVRFDDDRGCYDAASYLIQLGHKDIWYIGDVAQPWFRRRYEAYERAMTEHRLEARAQTLPLCDDPFENGHASVSLILERGGSLTAVLAGSDELAYGAIEALRQHGRDVPRSVSVIGFDHYVGRSRLPNLTCVCVDTVEVGRQLARLAIERIHGPDKDLPEVVVSTVLVKRSTCRPCRPEQHMLL